MDNSFTEHVLERARERQKKLGPLREANVSVSQSSPNVTRTELVKSRKEVVSDSILLVPKMAKSNSTTKISSNISGASGSPAQEFNTLNIQKDSLNMEIRFSSAENVRVEVEIQSDDGDNPDDSVENSVGKNIDNGQESDTSGEKPDDAPVLRAESKTRLQRLGKLYSETENLSSPISRNEAKFRIDNDKEPEKENVERGQEAKRVRKGLGLGKLAELAKDINQWEDDITSSRKNMQEKQEKKPSTPKKWKQAAPQPPKVTSPKGKATHGKPQAPKPPVITATSAKKPPGSASKQLKWDKAVLDTLESQGFTRTESNSRLVYNFKHSQENETQAQEKQQTKEKKEVTTKAFESLRACKEENLVTPRSPVKSRAIASRAALFETTSPASPKKEKDPALLSVSERKALFEKNKGEALVPKAAFGMAAPIAKVQPSTSGELDKKSPTEASAGRKEGGSIAEKIALLNQTSGATISQQQIEEKVKEERRKEMEVLMNRFNRNKQIVKQDDLDAIVTDSEDDEENDDETTAMIHSKQVKVVRKSSDMPAPPPPPTSTSTDSNSSRKSGEKRSKSGDSLQVQAVLGDIKRIKVTQPKDGKLYPCLSDIEQNTETEHEPATSSNNSSLNNTCSDNETESLANTSLSREVLKVCYTRHQTSKRISEGSTDASDILDDMAQYLNEMDSDPDSECIGPTPAKLGKPSQSFQYKKFSPQAPQKSPSKFRSPCKIITSPRRDSNLPTHVMDGSEALPLTYTVSFYRKQQTQGGTPVRHIVRHPEDDSEAIAAHSKEQMAVQMKIAALKTEINRQQMVISQASSALNLCIATPEFTGSTEQVEAEKLLLLAAHRRQAATQEIQRLEVEQSLHPGNQHGALPIEKGTLSISNVVLPLKKEYTKALAAAGGKGHHVVCLVKCGEQIVDTPLVSTVATSKNDLELKIPGTVRLENVYSDFRVTLEVYCLQAQEEILPHEVKYHIGKKANRLTPRKGKQDSRMLRPPKESPAGPTAVRTSSFALNGYVIFSIHAIGKTHWTLNQTPPISPLEGSVSMRVACELDVSVEQRGFLNMFEDVSGLGAWHRRWCLLKGSFISYWKYPEDERKKAPIDTIDLRSCTTAKVGSVSREVCARLHTFLLENERPRSVNDRETLTVSCHGDKTIIKHLLSADTKEERVEWCANLNQSLSALRMCLGVGGMKTTDF